MSTLFNSLLSLALSLYALPLFAASVKVQLDQNETEVGSPVTLSVVVEGSLDGEIEFPSIPDLSILGSGQSKQIVSINGRYTQDNTTYTFQVLAQKKGTYTIPPLSLKVDGEILKTESLTFSVKDNASSIGSHAFKQNDEDNDGSNLNQDDETPLVFIERKVSNSSPYEGEPIMSTVKIYHRVELAKISNISEKSPNIRYMELGQDQKREHIGNYLFNVVIYKEVLIPNKSGDLMIPAFRVRTQMVAEDRKRSRSPDDLFAEFFNRGFNRMVEKTISSIETPIKVQVLPKEGKPQNFKGVVGNFSVLSSLSTQSLKVGDTSTLSLIISGEGSLDPLGLIQLDLGPNIKVYADKPEVNEKATDKGLESKRVYRFALVPNTAGDMSLSAFHLSFFNPNTQKYQTLTTDLGRLQVLPSGEEKSTAMTSPNSPVKDLKQNVKTLAVDLIDIDHEIDVRHVDVLTSQDLVMALFVVGFPSGAFFVSYLMLALIRKRKDHPDRKRSKAFALYKQEKEALTKKYKTEVHQEHTRLVVELYAVYRQYLGHKYNLQGLALSSRDIEQLFTQHAKLEKFKESAKDLARSLELLEFGQTQMDSSILTKMMEQMETLIKEIEKI